MNKNKIVIGLFIIILLFLFLKNDIFRKNNNEILLGDTLLGDVDGNGKIGSNDYILIKKHILGIKTLSNTQKQRADVDNDGNIKSSDYMIIIKSILYGTSIEEISRINLENISNAVGICYSTWFNPIIDSSITPPRVTGINQIEAGAWYYWSKPAKGFYRSDNQDVIKYHINLLSAANVDFIIIDNTNVSISWKNLYSWLGKNNSNTSYWQEMISKSNTALLDTILEMNKAGIKTPRVVNWINTNTGSNEIDAIYNEFYTNSKYTNVWLYYEGKPLVLTTSNFSSKVFTTRKMLGLEANRDSYAWSFLEKNNKPSTNNEQISVSVAVQETYMSEPTAACRKKGLTFYNQWENAFRTKPKVVTITWWNEWTAIALNVNGKIEFTDNYSVECSRDIEPMEGGHKDKYYKLMKAFISHYKNNENIRTYEWYKNYVGL